MSCPTIKPAQWIVRMSWLLLLWPSGSGPHYPSLCLGGGGIHRYNLCIQHGQDRLKWQLQKKGSTDTNYAFITEQSRAKKSCASKLNILMMWVNSSPARQAGTHQHQPHARLLPLKSTGVWSARLQPNLWFNYSHTSEARKKYLYHNSIDNIFHCQPLRSRLYFGLNWLTLTQS